jgi:hypothetical protein
MKAAAVALLLLITGSGIASLVVGTPEIPSMDPFCAS